MKNLIDLSGKTILITGASSGIGAETANLCAQLGAKTVLIARREDKLQETIANLEGEGHVWFSYDLSDVAGIETLMKQISDAVGPIDGFVHSAGIPGTRPLKMFKPGMLADVMNVNFAAFFEIVRCLAKRNVCRDGASIVGISSVSSKIGSLGKTGYSASKAAMDGAARSMAKELAPRGIRVNTICPGLIDTAIYKIFQNNAGDSQDAQAKLDRQYLGLGTPTDIANVAVFLLSDVSRMITGSSINVDGGMLSS